MIDSILQWAGTVDWNTYVETAIDYAYILYYLPLVFLLIGVYCFLTSVSLPSGLLRSLLAILVTMCFYYFHQKHVTVPQGEMDFELIGFVALEYIIGASLSLLAIFITCIRAISTGVKNVLNKNKSLNVA